MEYVHPGEREFGGTQEPYGLALNEIAQARETGQDVTAFEERLKTLARDDDAGLLSLYADILKSEAAGSAFFDKSDWASIAAELPPAPAPRAVTDLPGRIEGAWNGSIAANMLGKPVEWQWPRGELERYLRERNAWPLDNYIPIDNDWRVVIRPNSDVDVNTVPKGFFVHEGLSRDEIAGGVRDDDIDFSVLGLHLLETFGANYTTYDVAHEWLTRFPLNALFTAERAAYNNLIRNVRLDEAGEHHNPFREWIGALIRADAHGYAYAGDPRRAARSTYADAWISHRSNGIYGEMWAAALIATAFTADTAEQSIVESLDHIPARSRLAHEIAAVLADFRAGRSWDEAMDAVDKRHNGVSWIHTLNNAGALTAAILWGEGDFSRTIALAVLSGLDTDSIGATAGSWAGAFNGIAGIPRHWIDPLQDRTTCALFGYGEVRISDLVRRTLALKLEPQAD